jgi:hypothetical protein
MISSRLHRLAVKPRFEIDVLIVGIADRATRRVGVVRGKRQSPPENSLGTAIAKCS